MLYRDTENEKKLSVATTGTIAHNHKGLARGASNTTWLPWLPRTQPRRVWTPFGLHERTFAADNLL
jgi:hypothetical protein